MVGFFKALYYLAGIYFIVLVTVYVWQRSVNQKTEEESLKYVEDKFKL